MSFEPFQFDPALNDAIEQAKFTRASKVQQVVIPEVLKGHDILVSAHSGSGKSASFVLPLIQRLLENPRQGTGNHEEDYEEEEQRKKPGPRVLILTPTRELANQVSACIRRFTRELELRYGILVGGAPYPPQVRMLKRPIDFLVATPGRLLDHLRNGRVNFSDIEYLVIDELARILDMNIEKDLLQIVEQVYEQSGAEAHQTLIFSSSLDNPELDSLSEKLQKEPVRFELARNKASYRKLNQSMYIADEGEHKYKLVEALLEKSDSQHILVFSHLEEQLKKLSAYLKETAGAEELGENKLELGESNKQVYLALDEQALDHDISQQKDVQIIHLDLPDDILVFLQRLESAIDQESTEELYILVGKDDWSLLHQIERYIGKTLSRKKIPGLEPEASEPSVSSKASSGKNGSQTKNRNPYSGRRQNNAGKKAKGRSPNRAKGKGQPKNKKRNQNTGQVDIGQNDVIGTDFMDDRERSWKQYISDISNGTGQKQGKNSGRRQQGKNSSRRHRNNQGGQSGNFDLNNSPMAISAKNARNRQNDEWIEEKPSKPEVQIKVKGQGKPKKESGSNPDQQPSDDNERIDGKLGIQK